MNTPCGSDKPRILIVDDNTVIRDLIKSFYADYTFELFEAANGREAFELACRYSPDVILLDIEMPVLNGYEAAALLKEAEPVKNIPIIIITGLDRSMFPEQFNALFTEYLSKPFKRLDLLRVTLQCLIGREVRNSQSRSTEQRQTAFLKVENKEYDR